MSGLDCQSDTDHLQLLQRWFVNNPGRFLASQEQECLERLLPGLFGYYLVQIGNIGFVSASLRFSPIQTQVQIDGVGAVAGSAAKIAAEPTRLPLATDSIDAVILPHTLDFCADPHQVLREVERILIPEGRLIVIGFNPWSLWGVWRTLCRLKTTTGVPWCGQFLAARRVHDWLSLLGFDLEVIQYLMFSPPMKRSGLMQRFGSLERLGGQWWPMLGAVYVIQAVKRVSKLTPVGLDWRQVRAKTLGAGAIEPTARNSHGK